MYERNDNRPPTLGEYQMAKKELEGDNRPKYPNRITVCMTDDLMREIRHSIKIRHMMGDLYGDVDALMLQIVAAIDDNESGPIFLRSQREAKKAKVIEKLEKAEAAAKE